MLYRLLLHSVVLWHSVTFIVCYKVKTISWGATWHQYISQSMVHSARFTYNTIWAFWPTTQKWLGPCFKIIDSATCNCEVATGLSNIPCLCVMLYHLLIAINWTECLCYIMTYDKTVYIAILVGVIVTINAYMIILATCSTHKQFLKLF